VTRENANGTAPEHTALTADHINACSLYGGGSKLRELSLTEVGAALDTENQFVWLDIDAPTLETMAVLRDEFGLHVLATEDAHRARQRPKLESYDDALFIAVNTCQIGDGQLHFGEVHCFFNPSFLIVIRHGEAPDAALLQKRAQAEPTLLALGPAYALYCVLDAVVDQYFPALEWLEDQLESLEEAIFRGRHSLRRTTRQTYALKKSLMMLRRRIVPVGEMLRELVRHDSRHSPTELRPYFRDIQDHALRIQDALESIREMLTTATNVSLAQASLDQSDITKRLAGWGALLAIPTVVSGVYGMNFDFMPELKWPYGYPLVVALTFVGCLFLYRKLKRARWL
jgi:magnesium transporter